MKTQENQDNSQEQRQPLLHALTTEATRRGETLASLAASLGVTYERLAQWRRGEGSIAKARRAGHDGAAKYLGIPTVLVMALAGLIRVEEFVWPSRSSLRERVARDLERMRANPFVGAFVPRELDSAPESMKLFVLFLFHELEGEGDAGRNRYRWLADLHNAAAGERSDSASQRLF